MPNWLTQPERRHQFAVPLFFFLTAMVLFSDVLFTPGWLGSGPADLKLQFIAWRQFGFESMRAGEVPLWNPYLFGGAPFHAGFQSALFYPVNWLHLVLPLSTAINFEMVINLFLAGYFTYLWIRNEQVTHAGAIIGGLIYMLSGAVFLRSVSGHLQPIAVMAWMPLVLLSLRRMDRFKNLNWSIMGMIAVAMQVLAGHPQYVFYGVMAGGLYAGMLAIKSPNRRTLLTGAVLIYVGGVLLSAIQLLPGLAILDETLRGGGTDYGFASLFSFSPINLVTSVMPFFFGHRTTTALPALGQYWGIGFLWENSIYIGMGGAIFAIAGAFCRTRNAWIALGMAAIGIVIALGFHTPVHRLLFDYLPMFSGFRGSAKFIFVAVLFLAMLAGIGFDQSIQVLAQRVRLAKACAIVGGICLLLAGAIQLSSRSDNGGTWKQFAEWIASTAEAEHIAFVPNSHPEKDSVFFQRMTRDAVWSAAGAGLVALAIAALAWRDIGRPWTIVALAAVVSLELVVCAWKVRETIHVDSAREMPDAWRAALQEIHPRDRVLVPAGGPNLPMAVGIEGVWGADPIVLRKYAEVMCVSQGFNPFEASQALPFHQFQSPLLAMHRISMVLIAGENPRAEIIPNALPVVRAVEHFLVIPDIETRLIYMASPQFNPSSTVILETTPSGISGASKGNQAKLKQWSANLLEITAEMQTRGVVHITNNFAAGWKARSAAGEAIDILPANHCQQAIVLGPGKQSVTLWYEPVDYTRGKWISVAAWAGLIGWCGWILLQTRKRSVTLAD